MLNDTRFAVKLGLLVTVGLLGLVVVSAATLRAEGRAESSISRMSGIELQLAMGFSDLYALGLQTEQATRNVLLSPRDETAQKNYKAAHEDFVKTVDALVPIAPPAMKARVEAIRQRWAEVHALKLEVQRLAQDGRRDDAVALLVSKETPVWREVKASILELKGEQRRAFDATRDASLADLRRQRLVVLATMLLVAAAFLAITIPVVRVTTRRVGALTRAARRIAEGDLGHDPAVEGRDEVGMLAESFRAMLLRLREIVSTLKSTAQELGAASERLMQDIRAQASFIERQASGVTETSTTTRELEQTAALAARTAASVHEVARRGMASSESGHRNAERSFEELHRIQGSVEGILGTSARLVERIKQVSVFAETARDLASQSHVLSLNASIEAARAGEAGRGFALVAHEVRALAEQSGAGAVQIGHMVRDILASVRETLDLTEAGSAGVSESLSQIRVSGESLKEIGGLVRETSDAALQIAAAVQQQSTGISQIAAAMRDIDAGMDDSLARIRSLAEAAQQVTDTATRITGLVDEFQT